MSEITWAALTLPQQEVLEEIYKSRQAGIDMGNFDPATRYFIGELRGRGLAVIEQGVVFPTARGCSVYEASQPLPETDAGRALVPPSTDDDGQTAPTKNGWGYNVSKAVDGLVATFLPDVDPDMTKTLPALGLLKDHFTDLRAELASLEEANTYLKNFAQQIRGERDALRAENARLTRELAAALAALKPFAQYHADYLEAFESYGADWWSWFNNTVSIVALFMKCEAAAIALEADHAPDHP